MGFSLFAYFVPFFFKYADFPFFFSSSFFLFLNSLSELDTILSVYEPG